MKIVDYHFVKTIRENQFNPRYPRSIIRQTYEKKNVNRKKIKSSGILELKGALGKYKNPVLRRSEKLAWELFAKEKHENS